MFDVAKKKNSSPAQLFAWRWKGLQSQTRLMSAHKSWMVCLLSAFRFLIICWVFSITICFLYTFGYGYSWEWCSVHICQREREKESEKDCLPSKGRLRVANHPIIWIKQVAPHWESSLKWRSVLALGCLWKWKHISCLACSDFSNKVRLGRGEAFPDAE